jgi:hypothetical protein
VRGIDGVVNTSIVYDDGTGPELYVGGDFRAAGDIAARNVAKWNGVRWAPLGDGLDGAVQSFHVWNDGTGTKLWAGKAIPTASSIRTRRTRSRRGTARRGRSRRPARSRARPRSRSRPFDDGSGSALYMSGAFGTIQGVVQPFVQAIARFDGNAVVAGRRGDQLCGERRTLRVEVHDDGTGARLFAGGYQLRSAPGGAISPVWTWDGVTWTSNGAGYFTTGIAATLAERSIGGGASSSTPRADSRSVRRRTG